jgi:chromosomal replication initiator protein
MYLARRHTRFSLEEIGGYFGGRDHTTVMHAVRTVTKDVAEDPEIAQQLNRLEAQLAG